MNSFTLDAVVNKKPRNKTEENTGPTLILKITQRLSVKCHHHGDIRLRPPQVLV